VPSRNDQLIYYDIGYWFFANMLSNGMWIVIFSTFTWWGFVLGLMDISFMLATNIYIMMISDRTSVTITELIGLRGGFTIYSGWVTAATIINVAFLLKSVFGFADPMTYVSEEQIAIVILFVALAVYNLASYIELNPLYGSVFIWVLMAIRYQFMSTGSLYPTLIQYCEYMALFQSISMTVLWSSYLTTEIYDINTGVNRGLFY
jgi:hypothetical protein